MITTAFPVIAAEVSIGGVILGNSLCFFPPFLKYKKLWEVYIKAFPQAPKYGRKAALKIRSLKASCI